MNYRPKILVVGSFVMDVIAATKQLPKSGQTVYGQSFHTACGGKGANQAVQCARLGSDVTMVGCVGDDLFGRQLLDTVGDSGVDISHCRVQAGVTTGVGHVTLEVKGVTAQNRIIVISGANLSVSPGDIAFLKETIGRYDMVLLQLEVPLEINRTVARWAKDAGVPVMLNPAPATELDDELLSCVTYLTPNEQEAAAETHLPLRADENGIEREDLQQIADSLRSRGVEHVIITLGGSGSAVVEPSGIRYASCVRMPQVADPTAAGDSFVAAFCIGITAGLSQEEAITFASYTAAITVSRMGAMPSLPRMEEVQALMEERKYAGFDGSFPEVLR